MVTPGSPADRAGLQVGDGLAEFGSVNAANFTELKAVADVVSNSRGQALTVRVVRGGRSRLLRLTPQEWAGRGLLGCNIVPVERQEDVVDR